MSNISGDLSDLYQELILDHNRNPRNFGPLESANREARGHNPLCGDKLSVHVQVEGDRIGAIRFEGSGCAISKASASLMTEAVAGRTLDETLVLFDRVHAMLTSSIVAEDEETLGKLTVLSGVRDFPIRVKCASLAWHTLKAAIAEQGKPATTE